jgi:hypothetical protein
MKSKITELGVFCIGLGFLFAVLATMVLAISPRRDPAPNSVFYTIAYAPTAIMIFLGGLVLTLRNKFAIISAIALTTLTFGLDGLIGLSPLKMLISGGIVYVIWKNGREALAEADRGPWDQGPLDQGPPDPSPYRSPADERAET